jgi:hypothetical protein
VYYCVSFYDFSGSYMVVILYPLIRSLRMCFLSTLQHYDTILSPGYPQLSLVQISPHVAHYVAPLDVAPLNFLGELQSATYLRV